MFNYILYRIAKFISLRLPLKLGYGVAAFISNVNFLISRTDRRTVISNLNAIFPNQNNTQTARLMFVNFGKYLIDFFSSERILDEDYLKEKVKIENIELIDKALEKKKGVIVVAAHIGSFELGGMVVATLGYPFSAIALPHKDERIDKMFNYQREITGEKVIPLGKAARRSLKCLRDNEIIVLVGDRDFTPGGITEDFFGRKALIPKGPAGFSLKTGAPIITAFMIRQKDDSFKLIFGDLAMPQKTGDNERDIHLITAKFLRVIEDYIKKYPSQWLMFRNFWIE